MMNVNMQDLKYQAVGLPDEVRMYHYAGDFAGELSCIDRWLARQVPDYLRKRLELQSCSPHSCLTTTRWGTTIWSPG